MFKPTHSLVIATITSVAISLTPTAQVQAQLNDGVPSAAGLFDTVFNFPTDTVPDGNFGSATTLTQINLTANGVIAGNDRDYNFVEVNIDGGETAGFRPEFFNSEVNLISGTLGSGTVDIEASSTLNMSGGVLTDNWDVFGIANVTGGSVGGGDVESGGIFNFSGGTATTNFDVLSGGTLNLSGSASIGSSADFELGSVLNISGGTIGNNLDIGGIGNISGGSIGLLARALSGSVVNFTGGSVAGGFDAAEGSEVNISGGDLGNSFDAQDGSVVNISGGTFGSVFNPEAGSEVNISGGTFGDFFTNEGSTDISGGTLGNSFRNLSESVLNLTGTEFLLDGVLLDSLVAGEAFTINDRDVTLSGLLADGTPFEFDLNATNIFIEDFFSPESTLTVTLGSPVILGDVNLDGVVNFFDIAPFIEVLSAGEFQAEADIDLNQAVNFFDIAPFIDVLAGN